MPDEQKPDDPTYGWLYSGAGGRPPQRGDDPGQDPEPTQMIDRQDAEDPRPDADAPEHTQGLDVGRSKGFDPPESTTAAEQKPQSFGGTYEAPPRRPDTEAPRFAAPVQEGRPTGAPPGRRPATTETRPPKPPGNRRKWWIRGILALILVWILFLVLVPIWAWSKISKVDAEPGGDRPSDTGGTTYLLVGSDSREGLTKQQKGELGTGSAAGQRTDTILMLHIPDGGGPDLLLSIPRDSYVDIPGHGQNKINAAYAFGGPKLLVQTVEQNTGLRVDDYIEIGFTGFVDIVDAVGGIEVCPKESINDPKAGHLKMHKGCQDVDGHTALSYSRSRHFSNGDITRTEHQREVISQVGKKAASWSTILLPWRYFQVNKAGAESLRIGDNVGPFGLAKFAWAMAHSGDSKRCVVPFSSLGTPTAVGSVVTWDKAKADALFAKIREDDTSDVVCDNGEQ
jgi:LCP family protein required for cell wall assembly